MFEDVVAVSQDISQSHDLMNVADLISEVRIVPSQPGQGLADNLQLAFDNELQGPVVLEVAEGLAPAEGLDLFDRAEDVLAEFIQPLKPRPLAV